MRPIHSVVPGTQPIIHEFVRKLPFLPLWPPSSLFRMLHFLCVRVLFEDLPLCGPDDPVADVRVDHFEPFAVGVMLGPCKLAVTQLFEAFATSLIIAAVRTEEDVDAVEGCGVALVFALDELVPVRGMVYRMEFEWHCEGREAVVGEAGGE